MSRRPARARIALSAATVLTPMLLLVGCSTSDGISGEQSYVSGDGTVSEFAPETRGDPIVFSGATDQGGMFDSTEYQGRIVVVNFWYASCPPCRIEAPWLEELAQQFADDEVSFIGVNIRDDAGTALAFARTFEISYPSILDTDATVMTAFAGQASPAAVPTTIVLDREGRAASRIVGLIDRDVLEMLIATALDERGGPT